MKIAVTGASGFIGKAFMQHAAAERHSLVALQRKAITNSENIESVAIDLTKHKPDKTALKGCNVLVHLAAIMQGERDKQRSDTLTLTRNILDAAYESGIRHFILISSMAALDYSDPIAIVDEHTQLAHNEDELGNYAFTKLYQERFYREWLDQHECSAVILRPGLVYDEHNLSDAHAGFIKSKFGFGVKHDGRVPIVSKESTVNTILDACNLKSDFDIRFHNILDGELPPQAEYLQRLKNRGNIKFALPISESGYKLVARAVRKILSLIGLKNSIPDAFRLGSVEARFSARHFSSKPLTNIPSP